MDDNLPHPMPSPEHPDQGLFPGEDFGHRVSMIFGFFDPGTLLASLDRLSPTRLRAFFSGNQSADLFNSTKFSNVIKKTPTLAVEMIDRGMPLNTWVAPRNTALGMALSLCNEPLVHALLARGASLDRLGVGGDFSPLALVATALRENGQDAARAEQAALRLGRICIDAGVDVDGFAGSDPPLSIAGRHGNFAFAEMLLEAGATQRRNPMGQTPLQVARANGHHEWACRVVAWQQAKQLHDSTEHPRLGKVHRRSL